MFLHNCICHFVSKIAVQHISIFYGSAALLTDGISLKQTSARRIAGEVLCSGFYPNYFSGGAALLQAKILKEPKKFRIFCWRVIVETYIKQDEVMLNHLCQSPSCELPLEVCLM